MNPEDVRKLVGGYATGSLSEAERKLLFEAAMQDQELFDELAGEHALKEILEEPGARKRLLAALEQKSAVVWWSRPWPWMTAAVTVAIAIIVVVSQRIPPPPLPQIGEEMIASKAPPEVPAAPPPVPIRPKTSPPPEAPPAAKPSVDAIAERDAVAEVRKDKAEAQLQPQRQTVGAVSEFAARGGRAEALTVNVVSTFAFNYTVRADGVLEIVPASPGFLSVTASPNVLLPSTSVPAGTPVRVQIPADATSLSIGFYAMQGSAVAPVRRDGTSGTVTDQDPPNGRISIQLSLTPRTQ